MITLTTPPDVNSVLGGNTPVSYQKLVISPFTFDPVNFAITANVRLTSTTVPAMTPIVGLLTVNVSSGVLEMQVQQLDFYRRVQLSGGQITAVQTIVTNAQNALEAGIVSLAIVAGTQSAGV